jgi:hypothetical protein
MDGCIELVCKPSAEDGIIWVVEIYYVKSDIVYSCVFLASEGYWQIYFSQCIFSFETD